MKEYRCRNCGLPLPSTPLLHYRNMPAAAQYLPHAAAEDAAAELELFQCSGCGLLQLGGAPVPYYREVIRRRLSRRR